MIEQLILVRHGETVHNVAGIAQGWGDSALSEAGQRQVAGLAARVASLAPDAIFSSPLGRAKSTAEEIGRATGLPVRLLDELREMNYGTWEGQHFMEVRHIDADNYHRWIQDMSFPCPEGESHNQVLERLQRAFAEIFAASRNGSENAAKTVARPVVVTHGTAIRIAATALLDLPLDAARHFAQDNAAMNIFVRRGERWVLKRWNDTAHCG